MQLKLYRNLTAGHPITQNIFLSNTLDLEIHTMIETK